MKLEKLYSYLVPIGLVLLSFIFEKSTLFPPGFFTGNLECVISFFTFFLLLKNKEKKFTETLPWVILCLADFFYTLFYYFLGRETNLLVSLFTSGFYGLALSLFSFYYLKKFNWVYRSFFSSGLFIIPVFTALSVFVRLEGWSYLLKKDISSPVHFIELFNHFSASILLMISLLGFVGENRKEEFNVYVGWIILAVGGYALKIEKLTGLKVVFSDFEYVYEFGLAFAAYNTFSSKPRQGTTVLGFDKWSIFHIVKVSYLICLLNVLIPTNSNFRSMVWIFCSLLLTASLSLEVIKEKLNSFSESLIDVSNEVWISESTDLNQLTLPTEFGDQIISIIKAKIELLKKIKTSQAELTLAQEKMKIASFLAHDLRSPLMAINTYLKLNEKNNNESKALIVESSKRLNAMIQELMNSSKSNSSSPDKLVPVNASLLKVLGVISLENKSDVVLSVEENFQDVFVQLSELNLIRVFQNFINNSKESTTRENRITIQVYMKDGLRAVSIQDQGPGFPAEVLNHFGKLGLTIGKTNGNGLGLAFCKQSLEQANARVSAFNSPEGGARIEIIFG